MRQNLACSYEDPASDFAFPREQMTKKRFALRGPAISRSTLYPSSVQTLLRICCLYGDYRVAVGIIGITLSLTRACLSLLYENF